MQSTGLYCDPLVQHFTNIQGLNQNELKRYATAFNGNTRPLTDETHFNMPFKKNKCLNCDEYDPLDLNIKLEIDELNVFSNEQIDSCETVRKVFQTLRIQMAKPKIVTNT